MFGLGIPRDKKIPGIRDQNNYKLAAIQTLVWIGQEYLEHINMGMKWLQSLLIPQDFEQELPTLKEKTFQWSVDLRLHADASPRGSITHYSIGDSARGSFILAPGIASNTDIEPLMKAIKYWSLTHRYNVYCINSFLGDFQEKPTLETAQQNTYTDFVDLMNMSIDIIEKQCLGTWTCLVGHSLGGTGAIEIFNRRILANKKPNVSAAILFAPLLQKDHGDRLKNIYRKFYHLQNIPDYEFQQMPLQLCSPHDFPNSQTIRYVTVMPQFMDDACNRPLRPDLMSKWGIPVTIVAGGHDRKVELSELQAVYDRITKMPNGKLFKFVVFPNSKHSFIDQYKQWTDVLNLIRSQRIRKKQQSR